ncbi:WD40 repeat domain-containing protein [Streptomyces sp. NPDC093094]|uniref:WD40 repeat domain-containing protein n=1 Tax=Streptomyces sp. NPDC093094 TaxID=3366026 RepID=UPI0038095E9B
MNVEELVRDSLRELAGEQQGAAPDLAEQVLRARGRRRGRRIAAAVAAGAAVVAVATAVPLLGPGGAGERNRHAVTTPDGTKVSAHPDQSPPADLIAAGDVAMAAYYRTGSVPVPGGRFVLRRTYWLLDPTTDRYEKDTRWSFVAVAPGLETAAVLERQLPARRVGLLDLGTGKVERWIPLERGAGGLAYSSDGTKLVATTYGNHPDPYVPKDTPGDDGSYVLPPRDPHRTGFYVLDVASGKADWSRVAARGDDYFGQRQDFAFGRDGRSVYCQVLGGRDGLQRFYGLDGDEIAAPAAERRLRADVPARLSPDGRLAALGLTREVEPDESYSSVVDPRTGKEVAQVRGAQLLAWVDDRRLIAWERASKLDAPYLPRLVLVTLGEKEAVPLSGVREADTDPSRQGWEPVLARR